MTSYLYLALERLCDSKLEKNPEQYHAVQHIVAGSSIPAPYVVFGPPGTGTASNRNVTLPSVFKQACVQSTTANKKPEFSMIVLCVKVKL